MLTGSSCQLASCQCYCNYIISILSTEGGIPLSCPCICWAGWTWLAAVKTLTTAHYSGSPQRIPTPQPAVATQRPGTPPRQAKPATKHWMPAATKPRGLGRSAAGLLFDTDCIIVSTSGFLMHFEVAVTTTMYEHVCIP